MICLFVSTRPKNKGSKHKEDDVEENFRFWSYCLHGIALAKESILRSVYQHQKNNVAKTNDAAL